jgi:hypothetical protein
LLASALNKIYYHSHSHNSIYTFEMKCIFKRNKNFALRAIKNTRERERK